MLRSQKENLLKEFQVIFNKSATGVLVDYQGMSVEELTSLRKLLYENGTKIKILKNTLARKASQGTPFQILSDHFISTRALVYNSEDVVSPSKVLSKEVENIENLKLISGVLVSKGEAQILDESQIKDLGNLPSKEELIAKLLFLLNAPITNFARVLSEIPASFVRVLQNIVDSKK